MYSWGFEVVLFSIHNAQNGVSSIYGGKRYMKSICFCYIPVITKRAQLATSKIQLGGFDDAMCWVVMKM